MENGENILSWIEKRSEVMKEMAVQWAGINSHTANLKGLKEVSEKIAEGFAVFQEKIKWIDLPDYQRINAKGHLDSQTLAPALIIQKRPQAKKQALLVCHMDTVYALDDPFQEVKVIDDETINGPGITDAKGGIVVMLNALEAFEQSSVAQQVGWKVIINTDEEIGSPSSASLLEEYAKASHIGLVFEPSLPDGKLVGARKGSGNFSLVVNGKSAHAGRNPEEGCNAIDALSKCIVQISALTGSREGLTINFGLIQGGSAVNVVPDLAVAHYNVRYLAKEDQGILNDKINDIVDQISKESGVQIKVYGKFSAPPKMITEETRSLQKLIEQCGKEINVEIGWRDTGGVCDGNRLQAAGLPTVDTLGVVGGDIHSDREYLKVKSLVERTQLTTLCLLNWASDK